MAVLHKSASTGQMQTQDPSLLRNCHWWVCTLLKQNLERDSTILVFSQFVSLFLDALYPCGFESISSDILLLSHKVTRHRHCKNISGETKLHLSVNLSASVVLSHACTRTCPGALLVCYNDRGMLFNGTVRAVGHNCGALGVSGEGGHASLQAQVSGSVLCSAGSRHSPSGTGGVAVGV